MHKERQDFSNLQFNHLADFYPKWFINEEKHHECMYHTEDKIFIAHLMIGNKWVLEIKEWISDTVLISC